MNIFIPSLSICSFSLLAVPLCSAPLSGLNLFAVACWCCQFFFLLLLPPLKLISIWDFLNKSFFSPHQRPPSSVFLFKAKSIPGRSRRWGTNHRRQHTKLFVSLNSTKRSSDQRLDFSLSGQTNRSVLKASLTDGAAVHQKASLTFQSAAAQIRQRRPFWDGRRLSDVLGG